MNGTMGLCTLVPSCPKAAVNLAGPTANARNLAFFQEVISKGPPPITCFFSLTTTMSSQSLSVTSSCGQWTWGRTRCDARCRFETLLSWFENQLKQFVTKTFQLNGVESTPRTIARTWRSWSTRIFRTCPSSWGASPPSPRGSSNTAVAAPSNL